MSNNKEQEVINRSNSIIDLIKLEYQENPVIHEQNHDSRLREFLKIQGCYNLRT